MVSVRSKKKKDGQTMDEKLNTLRAGVLGSVLVQIFLADLI